jgi:carboxyl-terminal processing protease
MEKKENIKQSKFSLGYLRKVFLWVAGSSLVFGIGYFLGLRNFYINLNGYPEVHIEKEVPQSKKDLDFSLFWTVWDTLDEKYYDKEKLIPAKMVYGAIRGMVSAIGDPYTVFLPPTENKIVQDDLKGSFEGVGIQLGYKDEWIAVMAPVSGSPADKKGVKAGDIIYGIRDPGANVNIESTQGMSTQEAVSIIRGKKGTSVFLTLVRKDVEKPFEVELVRDTLDIPSVIVNYVGEGNKIARIQLVKFAAETQAEWDESVVDLLTHDFEGIILDLRNNPGGYLQGAVDLGADFMEEGKVVVIEKSGSEEKEYKIEKTGRLRNRKVVVLINGGSASASEILSGALRDNKKVILVGETSFGKGTIQEPIEMDGGVGLHVTIAKWLTPSGVWVNGSGLKPDIEVSDNPDTEADEQLEAAVKALQ